MLYQTHQSSNNLLSMNQEQVFKEIEQNYPGHKVANLETKSKTAISLNRFSRNSKNNTIFSIVKSIFLY